MTGDMETKRDIFAKLGSNLILKDKIIGVDLENTLIPMQSVSFESQKVIDSLEPQEISEKHEEICESYSNNPLLLPCMDSNHNTQLQRLMSYH